MLRGVLPIFRPSTTIAALLGMLIFGRPILRLFISDETGQVEEVLGIAYLYLSIMSLFLAVLYALHTYRSALQGLGNTVVPMLSGIMEFIMRTTAVMLLPRFVGEKGVFYAEVFAWTGATVILVTSYYAVRRKIEKKLKII